MKMKPLPVPSAAFLQWLCIVLGLGFLCTAGFYVAMPLGFVAVGVSLIAIAFLGALGERTQ